MARITVEDCLKFVDNRFELVRIASIRARQLAKGGLSLVDSEHDKPTVLALREIAAGYVNFPEEKADLEPEINETLLEIPSINDSHEPQQPTE